MPRYDGRIELPALAHGATLPRGSGEGTRRNDRDGLRLARAVVAQIVVGSAGAGRWGRGDRRPTAGGRVSTFDPCRHRLDAGRRLGDLEAAFLAVPRKLVERDRDAMAADPQDAAGGDDEPLDLSALR